MGGSDAAVTGLITEVGHASRVSGVSERGLELREALRLGASELEDAGAREVWIACEVEEGDVHREAKLGVFIVADPDLVAVAKGEEHEEIGVLGRALRDGCCALERRGGFADSAERLERVQVGEEVERPALGDQVGPLRELGQATCGDVQLPAEEAGVEFLEAVIQQLLERVGQDRELRMRAREVADERALAARMSSRHDDPHGTRAEGVARARARATATAIAFAADLHSVSTLLAIPSGQHQCNTGASSAFPLFVRLVVSRLARDLEEVVVSIAVGFSNEEVRDLVFAYERRPYGTKRAWLVDRGISSTVMSRWRRAVFDGDLDRSLVPREGGEMTTRGERRQIVASAREQDVEKDRLRARVRELEAANEALGKAIGLLHQRNEREPDEDPTTKGPSSS